MPPPLPFPEAKNSLLFLLQRAGRGGGEAKNRRARRGGRRNQMAKKKRNCGVFPPLSVAIAEEWRRKRKTEGRESPSKEA